MTSHYLTWLVHSHHGCIWIPKWKIEWKWTNLPLLPLNHPLGLVEWSILVHRQVSFVVGLIAQLLVASMPLCVGDFVLLGFKWGCFLIYIRLGNCRMGPSLVLGFQPSTQVHSLPFIDLIVDPKGVLERSWWDFPITKYVLWDRIGPNSPHIFHKNRGWSWKLFISWPGDLFKENCVTSHFL